MQIELTKDILKSQVKILREFLKANDIQLTQSSAYIVLSKIHGFHDWHELSEELKNKEYENR
jgi:hypothetical protein